MSGRRGNPYLDDPLHAHTALEAVKAQLASLRASGTVRTAELEDELEELALEVARIERRPHAWSSTAATNLLARLRALASRVVIAD